MPVPGIFFVWRMGVTFGEMTIAPYVENPEENRLYFAMLRQIYVDIIHKNIDSHLFFDSLFADLLRQPQGVHTVDQINLIDNIFDLVALQINVAGEESKFGTTAREAAALVGMLRLLLWRSHSRQSFP